jgi:hypothetical protein
VTDEGFIRRTYRTSIIVWAIATVTLMAFRLWYETLGFTIGSAVSIGILMSLDTTIRRLFVPGSTGAVKKLFKVGFVKLLIIAAVLIGVIKIGRFDLIVAFCAGVLLTQSVMFLKVIGALLAKRVAE